MSLLDDIKDWYEEEKYLPYDLDDCEQVSEQSLGNRRWGTHKRWVYKRGEEFVAVEDVEPATEMQDWGDYGEPEIYVVEPYEVVVTKYRKVNS